MMFVIQTDRHACRQAERQTDRQTGRQAGRQIDRKERQTDKQADKKATGSPKDRMDVPQHSDSKANFTSSEKEYCLLQV